MHLLHMSCLHLKCVCVEPAAPSVNRQQEIELRMMTEKKVGQVRLIPTQLACWPVIHQLQALKMWLSLSEPLSITFHMFFFF